MVIHVDAKHSSGVVRGWGASFIVVREHLDSDGEHLQLPESLETLALEQRIGILAAPPLLFSLECLLQRNMQHQFPKECVLLRITVVKNSMEWPSLSISGTSWNLGTWGVQAGRS